jgi:hypothetical protein
MTSTANCGYLWAISTNHHSPGIVAEAEHFLETTLIDGRYGATLSISLGW